MDNLQVKNFVNKILQGKFTLTAEKNDECEYFRNDTCIATQQTTCKNCRFFSPNYMASLKRLAELYAEAQGLNIELNEGLKLSNKEITLLREKLNGRGELR